MHVDICSHAQRTRLYCAKHGHSDLRPKLEKNGDGCGAPKKKHEIFPFFYQDVTRPTLTEATLLHPVLLPS
jgi:hypothetical protein